MSVLLKFFLFVTILIVIKAQADEEPICACPFIYLPVCGSDLVTYASKCNLKCKAESNYGRSIGLKLLKEGACDNLADNVEEKLCVCTSIYQPVCGTDYKTYASVCLLKCEADSVMGKAIGLKVMKEGTCDGDVF